MPGSNPRLTRNDFVGARDRSEFFGVAVTCYRLLTTGCRNPFIPGVERRDGYC